MTELKDLFNLPYAMTPEQKKLTGRKKRREPVPNGYAAIPGTGPEGETCKTCQHIVRKQMSRTYLKCGLMEHYWTGGGGSDIRAKSPACKRWEKPE